MLIRLDQNYKRNPAKRVLWPTPCQLLNIRFSSSFTLPVTSQTKKEKQIKPTTTHSNTECLCEQTSVLNFPKNSSFIVCCFVVGFVFSFFTLSSFIFILMMSESKAMIKICRLNKIANGKRNVCASLLLCFFLFTFFVHVFNFFSNCVTLSWLGSIHV